MKFKLRFLSAGMAALIMLSGCKSADAERGSSVSGGLVTDNEDKPFTAIYSAAGGSAEDISAAADIIGERLKAVYEGDFTVTAEGNSVIIELPDKTDSEADELLRDIEKNARLTFRMGWSGDIPEGGSYEELELVLTGAEVATAAACYDYVKRSYLISVSLDEKGTEAFKTATQTACEDHGYISIWLDDEEILAPRVTNVISNGGCEIVGNFSADEAIKFAALINCGELPVELTRSDAEI